MSQKRDPFETILWMIGIFTFFWLGFLSGAIEMAKKQEEARKLAEEKAWTVVPQELVPYPDPISINTDQRAAKDTDFREQPSSQQ